MESLARAVVAAGVPAGSLRFLAALFSAPLVCAAHGALPGATLRHGASAALGVAMCLFVYGVEGSARLAPPVVAAALIMALSPRRAGPITFAVAFAYLIYWCARSAAQQMRSQGRGMILCAALAAGLRLGGPGLTRRAAARSHVASASGDAWKEGHIDYTGTRRVLISPLDTAACV